MNYLRSRLSQQSTWIGIAAAVGSVIANHGQIDANIFGNLMVSLGLVHVDA